MARRLPLLVSASVVVAVLAPALRDPPRDSFPLSTYPMFAHDRGRESAIATAVGVRVDGTREFLSPELIAGTDEPVQAGATVAQAVRGGDDRVAALCEEIAVRSHDDAVTAVEIVTDTYDAVSYFAGDTEPIRRSVHARCEVPA